jgi:hypothetical protein
VDHNEVTELKAGQKGKKTGKITTNKVILTLSQTHLLTVIISYNACILTCNNKNGC